MTENDAKIMRKLAEKASDNGVTYEILFQLEEQRGGQPRLKSRIKYLIDNGMVLYDASGGSHGTYTLTTEGHVALEDYELEQEKEKGKQEALKAEQVKGTRNKRISLLIAAVAVIIPLAAFLWGGDGLLNKPNQPTTHISAETATPPPSTSSPQLTPAPPKSNLETQTSSPPPTVNPHMTNLETWTAPPEPTLAPAQNEAPPPYSLELVSAYMENDCYHVEVSYSTNKDGKISLNTDQADIGQPADWWERDPRSVVAGDSGTVTFDLYDSIPGQDIKIYLEFFDRTPQVWSVLETIELKVP
jgi:hypothetical protein